MTQRLTAIVAQKNDASAAELALALRHHCRSVYVAHTPEDVRFAVPKHRAEIVIVDLEMLDLGNVRELRDQFGQVQIVCTHRLADEELWAQSLEAGADDCCSAGDIDSILRSAFRQQPLVRGRAA